MAIEATLSGRFKRVLNYFDACSKGGGLVYTRVKFVLNKSGDDQKNKYFLDLEGPFTCDLHWDCVKKNLDALLPTIWALDSKAELKAMTKETEESLL